MKKAIRDVSAFHRACNVPQLPTPRFPSAKRVALRQALLNEEHGEFHIAIARKDLAGVADALADIIYVAIGTALEFGIPLDAVWGEVQRSNMAKRDPKTGTVQRRPDGKIIKPEGWRPPDIASVLEAAR